MCPGDGSLDHRRHRRPRARPARERHAVRRHQDGVVLARPRPRAERHRRDRHRRHRLPRLLHLLREVAAAAAAGRLPSLCAPRRKARLGTGRGPHRLGGSHQDARLHPRERARGPTHALRARAGGGALPVDGGGPHPDQVGRRDRRDRSPYRGAAGVRRRRAELPRAHRVAGGRSHRERAAFRGDAPACRGSHHPHAAQPGARGRDAARGPLRRGDTRGPGAARGGRLPGLPPGSRRRRAAPGRLRPSGRNGRQPAPGWGGAGHAARGR